MLKSNPQKFTGIRYADKNTADECLAIGDDYSPHSGGTDNVEHISMNTRAISSTVNNISAKRCMSGQLYFIEW